MLKTGWAKAHSCEYSKPSLCLYYLLTIVLFAIGTAVNLLLPALYSAAHVSSGLAVLTCSGRLVCLLVSCVPEPPHGAYFWILVTQISIQISICVSLQLSEIRRVVTHRVQLGKTRY